jgi:ketosteroid isomerase-like protein
MRKSIASVFALLALAACRTDKPEDQVRKAFESCRAAVEAGDAAAATAPLDNAFRGPDGMDKGTARLFLMGILRQEKVGVTVVRNEVAVQGNAASQDVDLILTGRSSGLLPQDASQRSLRLRWRKVGSDWKLVEVQTLDGR